MDYVSKIQVPGGTTYNITGVIPMGTVASTSTSTVYTATISGITELKSGVCVWLTNGVVTSAANFTININGLGAKPVYRSNAATTRETTRFDKNYTIFLIYNETRVSGGCWDYVYGFDSNTTYTNMSQSEASAGTVTTGRIISAKVLSDTIEQHTAEINAVLPELVNEGAKNKLEVPDFVKTVSGITFTAYRGVIYATGTATADASVAIYPKDSETGIDAADVDIVVSGCTNGTATTYRCFLQEKTNNTYTTRVTLTNTPVEYHMSNVLSNYRYLITVYSGCTVNNKMFSPMVCTKAAWDISNVFFPYAKTNPELTICEAQDRAAIAKTMDNGVKNKLPIMASSQVVGEAVFIVNPDGSITVYTTATTTAMRSIALVQSTDNFYVYSTDIVSGVPSTDKDVVIQFGIGTSGNIKNVEPSVGYTEAGVSGYMRYMQLIVRSGVNISQSEPLIFRPMICSKADWDISQEYVPYALPNSKLTAATIEVIDNGTKNLLEHIAFTRTVNDVTYTVNADRSIQISSVGNNTQSLLYLVQNYTGVPAGNYVLSGCTGGSSTKYDLRVKVGNTTYINYDGGTEFYYNGTDNFESSIVVRASQTVNTTIKPMVCTKADWGISHSYQPYRPNIMDAVFGPGTEIIGTSEAHQDLNNYNTPGAYFCRNSTNAGYVDNKPLGGSGFRLTVENISGTNTFRQTFIKPTDASRIYIRHYSTSTWSPWYVFEGTVVT